MWLVQKYKDATRKCADLEAALATAVANGVALQSELHSVRTMMAEREAAGRSRISDLEQVCAGHCGAVVGIVCAEKAALLVIDELMYVFVCCWLFFRRL